jgi:hypothetical protein
LPCPMCHPSTSVFVHHLYQQVQLSAQHIIFFGPRAVSLRLYVGKGGSMTTAYFRDSRVLRSMKTLWVHGAFEGRQDPTPALRGLRVFTGLKTATIDIGQAPTAFTFHPLSQIPTLRSVTTTRRQPLMSVTISLRPIENKDWFSALNNLTLYAQFFPVAGLFFNYRFRDLQSVDWTLDCEPYIGMVGRDNYVDHFEGISKSPPSLKALSLRFEASRSGGTARPLRLSNMTPTIDFLRLEKLEVYHVWPIGVGKTCSPCRKMGPHTRDAEPQRLSRHTYQAPRRCT